MMRWLILVGFLAIGFLPPAQQALLPGTCVSIGYSTACCPPGEGTKCKASDGDCYCSSNCHEYGDCCDDVYCTSEPRTCADIGLTTCCNDANETGKCDVHFRDSENTRCSCNVSCHKRNDCCRDAEAVGCVLSTCTNTEKDPGCCLWSDSNSCYVPGGKCYCDNHCSTFNDCCDDVPTTPECDTTANTAHARLLRPNTVRSMLDKELKASTIRRYNEDDRRTQRMKAANAKSAYSRERYLSVQRAHNNAREFAARRRTAG